MTALLQKMDGKHFPRDPSRLWGDEKSSLEAMADDVKRRFQQQETEKMMAAAREKIAQKDK